MVLQTVADSRFDPQETLAELVLRHPACARVFQKHNLEFCCDGDRPLAQACLRRLLSVEKVIAELEGVASLPSSQVPPRRLPWTRCSPPWSTSTRSWRSGSPSSLNGRAPSQTSPHASPGSRSWPGI